MRHPQPPLCECAAEIGGGAVCALLADAAGPGFGHVTRRAACHWPAAGAAS